MSAKPKPTRVHQVEVGPVVISIFRGAAQDGHTYLYWEPARAFTGNTGKTNYSQRFYDRNEKDAVKAIQEASAWIRKNPQAADEGWELIAPAIAA